MSCHQQTRFITATTPGVLAETGEHRLSRYIFQFCSQKLPTLVFRLARALLNRGALGVYLVGGMVRDVIIGYHTQIQPSDIRSDDIDLEVYGLDFSSVVKIAGEFGDVQVADNSFLVAKLFFGDNQHLDITCPRHEHYSGKMVCQHCGKEFFYTQIPHVNRQRGVCPSCSHSSLRDQGDRKNYDIGAINEEYLHRQGYRWRTRSELLELMLKQAYIRRDTTINSMYISLGDFQLVDLSGGQTDILQKVIRPTDVQTFPEDLLRFYRVARQAAKFGFRVDPLLVEMSKDHVARLHTLEPARISEEMIKLFASGKVLSPSIAYLLQAKWIEAKQPERVLSNVEKLDKFLSSSPTFSPVDNGIKDPEKSRQLAVWSASIVLDGEPEQSFQKIFPDHANNATYLMKSYQQMRRGLADPLTLRTFWELFPDTKEPGDGYYSIEALLTARSILNKPPIPSGWLQKAAQAGYRKPPSLLNGDLLIEIATQMHIRFDRGPASRKGLSGEVVLPVEYMGILTREIREKQLSGELDTPQQARTYAEQRIREYVKAAGMPAHEEKVPA